MEIKLLNPSPDETSDIWAAGAVATCGVCESILFTGWPLWGMHLQVAVALHAAHRAADEIRDVPALTSDDRRLGRRIGVVED